MAGRSKSVLLGCGLTVAALAMLSVPQVISQEAQQSGTPLKDVCPAGWSRHTCAIEVRVCVSPDVDVTDSVYFHQECGGDEESIVPDKWVHARGEEVGYAEASHQMGYNLHSAVWMLDSSKIQNGDVDETVKRWFHAEIEREWSEPKSDKQSSAHDKGFSEFEPIPVKSLDTYGLHVPPPKASVKEVCPEGWRRFSCQFVRLCVAPSVTNRYNLSTSKEVGYAKCEMDSRSVGEEDTHSSPHDVGAAAGWMLLGPRYVGVVKLDASNILDGNLDEAIQRLVLVPLPTNALMEYARGLKDGAARFENYLNENRIKEKEIGKSPQ